MSLLERIMQAPELRAKPPVLVDVGAAGGTNALWKRIARYSVGLGFEPDARDTAKLTSATTPFLRWIYCPALVAPAVDADGKKRFYLTRSPHCSSLLKPRGDTLAAWMFADHFAVEDTITVPATTLEAALLGNGLEGVDWLKCDTQGQDLGIFMSLPESWRHQVLAVEFEPGLIDAYEGENKFWHVLRAMETEPFWLESLKVCRSPRGDAKALRSWLGAGTVRWLTRLGGGEPGWVNARYLREPEDTRLDRRALLLSWVFADHLGRHVHGLMVAEAGRARFGAELFDEMAGRSRRRLRWAMLRSGPGWLWRRFGPGR